MDSKSPALAAPTGASPSYNDSRSPGPVNGNSSKAPEEGLGGFVAQNKMDVVPPKKEDLQKSYATTV